MIELSYLVILKFLIGLMLGLAAFVETFGAWARVIGSANRSSAVGYSTHVRFGTVARFFILLAAPLLGFLVDRGASASDILEAGILASFTFMMLCWFLLSNTAFRLVLAIFFKVNPKLTKVNVIAPTSLRDTNTDLPVFYGAMASFFISFIGIIAINLVASIFFEHRAMIVQMSALISMTGTLLHVFVVDPRLAHSCDSSLDFGYSVVRLFIKSRLISSILLLTIMIFIYFLL